MPNQIILVVDDNKTARYVLEQLLEKFDYDAHLVSSGEEALAAMAVAKYAGVLMDIGLPGINGFECTRRIRLTEAKSGRRIPIIALTGKNAQSDRDDAESAGMDGYLSKPFEADELRKILLKYVYQAKFPNLKVLPPPRKDGTRD